jgi:hypothetical protein
MGANARDEISAWVWVAVVGFIVVGGCVLTVQRDLALHRSAAYNANAEQLRWLFWVFRIGLVMLVVEVAAWVIALAERA